VTVPARRRSTRDRPAKAPLSEQAVVDAALAILKSEGLEAVTMRRVATALDTGPGSLYVYVSGRDELLQAMQERVTATIELEKPNPKRWRAQLHALLGRMLDALIAHPGLASVSMADPPTSAATSAALENLLGLLFAGGVAPQDAAWAADIFAALVTFNAIEADTRRVDITEHAEEIARYFAALPPERYPLITANVGALVAGDPRRRFRFAVDVVLDGILARSKDGRPD